VEVLISDNEEEVVDDALEEVDGEMERQQQVQVDIVAYDVEEELDASLVEEKVEENTMVQVVLELEQVLQIQDDDIQQLQTVLLFDHKDEMADRLHAQKEVLQQMLGQQHLPYEAHVPSDTYAAEIYALPEVAEEHHNLVQDHMVLHDLHNIQQEAVQSL
jgi:hypothetical protein